MKLDMSEKKQDARDIDKIYDEIGEQNKKSMDEALKNIPEQKIDENQNRILGCSFCQKPIVFPDDFTCKFCNLKFCSDHIQLENHECVKTTPTKYLRKTWLRRYDLNISSGRYIVVCDVCGYVSQIGSLIDMAGEERKHHIANNCCDSKKVFLEEDLSHEKVIKDVKLEEVVPTDRSFWVCSHCRPPQKFTSRSEYIAHHYSHN